MTERVYTATWQNQVMYVIQNERVTHSTIPSMVRHPVGHASSWVSIFEEIGWKVKKYDTADEAITEFVLFGL